MEDSESLPGSPGGSAIAHSPLQPMSPDRINQQQSRDSYFSSVGRSSHARDSNIHDKIQQFNSLSHLGGNGAAGSMTRQLERKTADAALKRAMLGREEAESEMRRFREESRILRKQVEEGKERERRVGERLETVMENYGRAKETYAHTQALWEKEIRRARKETFKSQSSIVKLQEEVKAAKAATKSAEEVLERERERSQAREQEAFSARYQIVGVQEQLEQALERIKVIEQERDAFKTLAKNEEVARIAAEGRLPLPPSDESDDEFASPRKARLSLPTADVISSATSEAEIGELTRLWQWEKQRADRTQDHLEFLQAECRLKCCPCAKSRSRRSLLGSVKKTRPEPLILDAADLAILGQKPPSPDQPPTPAEETIIHQPLDCSPISSPKEGNTQDVVHQEELKEERRSTIFLPKEGVFRTLSQMEIEAMDVIDESAYREPPTPVDPAPEPRHYARTPSVDPPALAMPPKDRTSLLSLINAPRQSESHPAPISIPTTPGNPAADHFDLEREELATTSIASPGQDQPIADQDERPHTSASFYGTTTTTTTVPIRDRENVDPRDYINATMTGSRRGHDRSPSFDINNPALTPTMTREQALAQIKERRGRAKSAAQGAITPRRQMVTGVGERRDVSAPVGRAIKGRG